MKRNMTRTESLLFAIYTTIAVAVYIVGAWSVFACFMTVLGAMIEGWPLSPWPVVGLVAATVALHIPVPARVARLMEDK